MMIFVCQVDFCWVINMLKVILRSYVGTKNTYSAYSLPRDKFTGTGQVTFQCNDSTCSIIANAEL